MQDGYILLSRRLIEDGVEALTRLRTLDDERLALDTELGKIGGRISALESVRRRGPEAEAELAEARERRERLIARRHALRDERRKLESAIRRDFIAVQHCRLDLQARRR